ncbi:glycosyltransferase family 39 protein [Leptospira sp. 2 VSF19]|uniref:Glycosyltransferase family 39 protein n=1 Tax=Leptospira soteropolitanensis TaxID=2950025 RepID=A0AAW5VMB6_9LEPT|nr:glycosyltransferase family 39 protein [Leptospira soteropolitanensis]MCW7493203.1 glycosyltransferase family 39 protein [Leptospira soteropolitanensis]MCW7500728.1 glycosyltransferase family 39 protein [Leptospira soteropolitanensis]MCW7523053.1 glycosyltransferase family 39 protein [Leptospira soteropolitanensis]MCW7526840.1 glycosyltransferase family 39 protein [Leptospira soteropolitanensis]MCW7530771.1 glycosyltransferase family 39 protein [Leptospira soteropolitanensis]
MKKIFPSFLFSSGPIGSGFVFLLFILLAFFLRYPSFGYTAIDWDEITYSLIGEGWLQGKLPFRDLWDIKPIGIYLVYAIIHGLLGFSIFAIRVSTLLVVVSSAFIIWLLLRKTNRSFAFGTGFGFLILFSYFLNGLSGNTELFYLCLETVGVWFLFYGKKQYRFLSPLAFGFAFIIKYNTAFDILGFYFLHLYIHRRKIFKNPKSFFGYGLFYSLAILPFLISTAWIFSAGLGDSFLETHKILFSNYAKKVTFLEKILSLKTYPILAILVCVQVGTFILYLWKRRVPKILLISFFWTLTAFLAATWTGYFFEHYYLPMMIPTVIGSSFLLRFINYNFFPKYKRELVVIIVILFLIPVAVVVRKRVIKLSKVYPDIAKEIYVDLENKKVDPRPVFVAKGTHGIYSLYKQIPINRVIQPGNFTDKTNAKAMFIDNEEIKQKVKDNKPGLILFCDLDVFQNQIGNYDSSWNEDLLVFYYEYIRKEYQYFKTYFPNCHVYLKNGKFSP